MRDSRVDLAEVFRSEGCKHLGHRADPVGQRDRVNIAVDKDETAERVTLRPWEASFVPVEIDEVTFVGD